MNPGDASQTLVDAPQLLVVRDEAAPQLEAGVLEQLAQWHPWLGEGRGSSTSSA